jgi:uncharacterized membrane protein
MSTLVAVTYDDEFKAAEVLATLRRLQSEYLIDLEDAAYVTKGTDGTVKVHQNHSLSGAGALGGGFWGLLFGLIFFVPILGLAVGAGLGALIGHYSDYGIDKQFMESLRAQMKPGSSAIFVLVRKSTPDKVIPEIAKYGGTVVQTNLSDDAEKKLQDALDKAGKQPAATTS